MGVSRTWNGSVANYINTVDQHVFAGTFSHIAWIRPAALGLTNTIWGNSFDAGAGWRINSANRLELFWSNGAVYDFHKVSVPLLAADGASRNWLQAGRSLFVAITGQSNPLSANFYAGLTPNEVTFLGNQTHANPIAPNGVQIIALGVNMFGLTPQFAFTGGLDRLGRWQNVQLSLAELKAVAVCGAVPPQPLTNSFFYEITGASPEPNTAFAGGVDATIVGTLPPGPDLCIVNAPIPLLSVKYGIWAVSAEEEEGGGGGGSDGGGPPGGGGLIGEVDICSQL